MYLISIKKLTIFVAEKKNSYISFWETYNTHSIRKSAPKWSHYTRALINWILSISRRNNTAIASRARIKTGLCSGAISYAATLWAQSTAKIAPLYCYARRRKSEHCAHPRSLAAIYFSKGPAGVRSHIVMWLTHDDTTWWDLIIGIDHVYTLLIEWAWTRRSHEQRTGERGVGSIEREIGGVRMAQTDLRPTYK